MGPRLVTTPTDNILSAGHFLPSISSTPTAGSLGLKADRSLSQQGRGAHLQVCCRECLRRRCLLQMPGAAYISANSSELPAVQTHGCSALELPDLLRGRAAFLFASGHVCARYVPICWDKSTWTAMAWDFVLLFLFFACFLGVGEEREGYSEGTGGGHWCLHPTDTLGGMDKFPGGTGWSLQLVLRWGMC